MNGTVGRQWRWRAAKPVVLVALAWLWGLAGPQVAWCKDLGWQVAEAAVVSEGLSTAAATGSFTQGVEVRATATALGRNVLIQSGRLKLTFDLFSPNEDMPGQKAGRWYLVGTWRLEDDAVSETVRAVRHNPATLTGKLTADLDFNPMAEPGAFTALLRPSRIEAAKAGVGDGLLTLDATFAGDMTLQAKPGRGKGGAL